MKIAPALILALAASAAAPVAAEQGKRAEAYFAMGCFWSAESAMEKVPGVIDAISGFAGGKSRDPSYREVSSGGTGHLETVRVIYDPARVSYAKLLDVFWHNVDPFDANDQFCDKGSQYHAAIFTANPAQRRLALASKQRVEKRFGKAAATQVLPPAVFHQAEAFHQDFAHKNPERYGAYRVGCRRDARLRKVWGD